VSGPEERSDLTRLARDLAGRLGCEWIEWDGEGQSPPVPAERVRNSIVVCDGALDRVPDPAPVLDSLGKMLRDSPAALLAVADRDLADGSPAPRWNAAELDELLRSSGLDVAWMGLGRSPAGGEGRSSVLVALAGTRGGEVTDLLATGARNLWFDPEAGRPRAADRGEPLRICIASYEFVGPTKTGGIGTAYTSLAEALAEAGHEVTVLYLGRRDGSEGTRFSHWVRHYADRGIRLVELREEDFPAIHCGHVEARQSYLAYLWLAERDRERPFDVIHFPETLGHGYYTLLARRQGSAFAGTTIAIGVHSSTYWVMETNRSPFLTGQEFAADFIERASVAMADVVISPSAYMVNWMSAHGWELPERLFVQQYVRSRAVFVDGSADDRDRRGATGGIEEIVFFGRLEVRKGLLLFCDALDVLAADGALPDVSVAFMGKETVVDGAWARGYLRERGRRWPWKWRVRDRFGQHEAIAYLRGEKGGRRRLAVMPSLADNTPNTVMEALALGIPFIASRVGGTAELIHLTDLARCTFDPSGPDADRSLAAALREAVEATEFRPARPAVEPAENERVHVGWHEALAGGREAPVDRSGAAKRPSTASPVSVCVVGRRNGALAETIASLESQAGDGIEVVVVDDGRGAPLPGIEQRFADRGWRLVPAPGLDAAEAGNLAARTASGDRLVFVTPDSAAEPGAIATLVRVGEATGADVVTCASRWEVDGEPGIRVPEGGPPVAGLFYGCFGESGYLISRPAFEALGGFRSAARGDGKDHELLCRAALEGYRIRVVPEPLFRRALDTEAAERTVRADSELVLRTYQERASNGLVELPRVARAQWSMAGSVAGEFQNVLSSRSWRLTSPLRWATRQGKRLRDLARSR
jgi:O-antigen biosynthesis protein